jgi:cbb3-type cytochrome oxidase maturation protein
VDILFLLVPLSVLLALAIIGILAWAVWAGQFDDIEREGQRILVHQDEKESADTANPVKA